MMHGPIHIKITSSAEADGMTRQIRKWLSHGNQLLTSLKKKLQESRITEGEGQDQTGHQPAWV